MAETPTNTDGENQGPGSGTNGNAADAQTETVAKTEYEKVVAEAAALRKEKEQAELERNQKRNAAADAERKKAEADKDFDKLYEMMKADNEALKAQVTGTTTKIETDKARDEQLNRLPEKLRATAKDILSKATTPEQVAEKAQEIETLATGLGIELKPAPEKSPVQRLNPLPKTNTTTAEAAKTREQWRDDLHRRAMAAAVK